jgi:uncharacterized membrane protein
MTTETERLKLIGTPPIRTPELWEKYLPYAMALDVEKQWSSQFALVFSKLELQGQPYRPIWYVGRGFGRFNAYSMSSSMSRTLTSVVSSASTPPSQRKSGSDGGGFSGGGSGGGGGGGW